MKRNHIITLQKLNEQKKWEDVMTMHAGANKYSGKEYLDGGSVQSQLKLVFDVRYCKIVSAIRLNTQLYRIIYGDGIYKIMDYDDFKEQHKTVHLLGVSYRGG